RSPANPTRSSAFRSRSWCKRESRRPRSRAAPTTSRPTRPPPRRRPTPLPPIASRRRSPSASSPWSKPHSARQQRRAHQRLVDGTCGLAAFADRPHNQRLAAPRVARDEQLVDAGAIVAIVRRDVGRAARVDDRLEPVAELRQHTRLHRAGKADRDEGEVRLDDEFGSGDRPALLVDLAALDAGELAVLADELQRRNLERALCALGLTGGGAHLGRPVGPGRELVLLLGRLRTNVELRDAHRALPEGGADAVR